MSPLVGGTAASHALSLRTHPEGGPSYLSGELVYDVNSLQAEWALLLFPQFVYLACQAVAPLNIPNTPDMSTLEVSQEPMA